MLVSAQVSDDSSFMFVPEWLFRKDLFIDSLSWESADSDFSIYQWISKTFWPGWYGPDCAEATMWMIISVCLICLTCLLPVVKQTLKTKINCTVASCQLLEPEFIVGLFKHSFKILFLPDLPIKFLMLLIVRYVDVWIFFFILNTVALCRLSWCLTACLPWS